MDNYDEDLLPLIEEQQYIEMLFSQISNNPDIWEQFSGTRLVVEQVPASRLVQQIQFKFYSKPICPTLGTEANSLDTRIIQKIAELYEGTELNDQAEAPDKIHANSKTFWS